MPRVCSVSGAPLAILSLIMKTSVVMKDDATLRAAQSFTSSKADLLQYIYMEVLYSLFRRCIMEYLLEESALLS